VPIDWLKGLAGAIIASWIFAGLALGIEAGVS